MLNESLVQAVYPELKQCLAQRSLGILGKETYLGTTSSSEPGLDPSWIQ